MISVSSVAKPWIRLQIGWNTILDLGTWHMSDKKMVLRLQVNSSKFRWKKEWPVKTKEFG